MESTSFMRVDEVAQELGISKSYAYKIVQKLNAELKEKGFMTISGRVNKQYFMERTCYCAYPSIRNLYPPIYRTNSMIMWSAKSMFLSIRT